MRALPKKRIPLIAACATALLLGGPRSLAWNTGEDEEAEEEQEVEEPEIEDWYLAVTGADIYTGTGEVLRDGRLLAKNGKIVAIGYEEVEIPGIDYWTDVVPSERTFVVHHIDASKIPNARVYPGLVAITSSGLLGTGGDVRNSIDPFHRSMVLGLAAGITTTGVSNGAAKLKRYVREDPPREYDFDGIVLTERAFATYSYSSASSRRSLREKLTRAADYLRRYREWQEKVKQDKDLKEPSKKGVDSNTLAVLRGEVLAKFRANERTELLGIARIAQEFGFRPVIDGCREGWTVADELGRAGAFAIVTARDRRDPDERVTHESGSSIENAAILTQAGVNVAIEPASTGVDLGGIVGRDIMHLPMEVGFAIRGGLSEEDGLAAITSIPARILGISHRVGTLEVGKDCDLIVTDGDILHYQTFVQYTVVDGQVVYDKNHELYFAHIRPHPDALAPIRKLDVGENEVEEEAAAEGDAEESPADEEHGSDEEGEEEGGGGEGG